MQAISHVFDSFVACVAVFGRMHELSRIFTRYPMHIREVQTYKGWIRLLDWDVKIKAFTADIGCSST